MFSAVTQGSAAKRVVARAGLPPTPGSSRILDVETPGSGVSKSPLLGQCELIFGAAVCAWL